jgi:hypothetical protein
MRAEGCRRMRPRDHLLPEDLSLEFPVTGTTTLVDFPALDGQELGLGGRHCRSLSAPDEESESASWDVSSQASQNQTLKQVKSLILRQSYVGSAASMGICLSRPPPSTNFSVSSNLFY